MHKKIIDYSSNKKNFIEYTEMLIDEKTKNIKTERPNVLLVGGGYTPPTINRGISLIRNSHKMDLNIWIDKYRNSKAFEQFDLIILSRVFEHLPIREYDWYMYNLYTLMKHNAEMVLIIPNMEKSLEMLIAEFKKEHPDDNLIKRLHYEIWSEGPHTWDRHSIFTNVESMKHYFKFENLWDIVEIKDDVIIDSTVVAPSIEITLRRQG